ncbi:membrane-spanning 4-domains subfamily A member 15-like [Neolamprologus brichardi]|uniref:membrane-spanning 4-domains subfamily A member 15-like n=1 Tax=Neolamprologus brichardi TaxID=32507 RepID=UPI0003EC6360|nr:membrane-spanning 4-domains subfamily A member 15-like [Neolamprologus brichardi]
MSAELLSVSDPGGNNGNPQDTSVGGTKPLHRFLKGQPKIIGTIVLILGASFFIISIAITADSQMMHIWTVIPPGFLLGTLLIICGITYILAQHNTTKKTVTISLSLSIVSILVACWTLIHILPDIEAYSYHLDYIYDNGTFSFTEPMENRQLMGLALEAVLVFYTFVVAVIFIVMSALAGIALRSTKSQAIVVMTAASPDLSVE